MDSIRLPSQHRSPRHFVATVVILSFLLLLLLLPACGRSTGAATGGTPRGTPSPAASPSPTKSVAVPGPQPTWQSVMSPSDVDLNRAMVSFSIAPGDGDIAYLCVAPRGPSEATARIYVTRDRAATWTRGADIAVGAPPQASNHPFVFTCDLAVDANNPASALIMEAWVQIASEATVGLANYATFDFAAHWQKLAPSQPQHFIADGKQLASWHGNIYAYGTSQIPGLDQGMWVSADQMRSWRRLAPPTGLTTTTFWLNPSSGALLMLAGTYYFSLQQPYRSDDHGATWTAIATLQRGWFVAAPQAGQPWHLCRESPPTGGQPGTVSCTADGGQTWTPPQPGFVYWTGFTTTPKGITSWGFVEAGVFAIAVDGAVLAAGDRVYRLPPGASVWQDLGSAPASPTYYPTSAGGVLWLRAGAGWMVASYPAL